MAATHNGTEEVGIVDHKSIGPEYRSDPNMDGGVKLFQCAKNQGLNHKGT